jgi:4'-phosphopantetheinyl transferase
MSFEIAENEVNIWTIYLPKFYHLANSYLNLLDQTEKDIASRFHFHYLKINYIVTHGIIRTLLSGYINQKPDQIEIKKTSFGKPFIENHPLRFNLSHSKNYAICVFGIEREVGIDIEYIREDVVDEALTESILSAEELEIHKRLSQAQKIESFFVQWTRKEAFLKALGTGIKVDLKYLSLPQQLSHDFINIPIDPLSSNHEWVLNTFFPKLDYVATVVCQSNSNAPYLKIHEY